MLVSDERGSAYPHRGVAPPLRRACHTPGHAPTRHESNINVTGVTSQAFQVSFFSTGRVGTCPDKPTCSATLQCNMTGGETCLLAATKKTSTETAQRDLRAAFRTGLTASIGLVTAPSEALETLAAYLPRTPLVV